MTFLLDTSEDLDVCAQDLGVDPVSVGQLITPLTKFSNRGAVFAIDNGCFSGLRLEPFLAILEREKANRKKCIFVTVPDVVCSMRRTLELFQYWQERLHGWPLALAIQNGVEHFNLPWPEIDAVFIGGDDAFKSSAPAVHVIRAAQALGKWVHVGRVNEPVRFRWCQDLAVDSIDGSGISQYSHQRRQIHGGDQVLLDLEPTL